MKRNYELKLPVILILTAVILVFSAYSAAAADDTAYETVSCVLGIGESIRLPETKNPEIDTSFLRFDGKDGFTALKLGETEIFLPESGKTYSVEILPAPKKIGLNAKELTLGVGESFNFNSSIPKGTASRMRKYSAEDPNVMKLGKSGVFTALKPGVTTVRVMSFNGKTAECSVTVLPAPKKIVLNAKELTLGVGESFNFNSSIPKGTASRIRKYKSSNPSVMKLGKSGIFTALKKGTATVTVTTFNGKTAKCRVTVLPAPKSVVLNAESVTLGLGESFDFNSDVPKGTASHQRIFKVKNKKVLSLGRGGVVKAKSRGRTEVTVTTFNGKTASCTVTVLPLPPSFKPKAKSISVYIGSKTKPNFTFPKGTYCSSFSFKSSDPSVAYADKNGKITAVKNGSAVITAVSPNKKKAKFTVSVRSMPVPFVNQNPTLPTGCEAASCVELLKYYGYSISLSQMASFIPHKNIQVRNGKRYGPDINTCFVGNPAGTYTSKNPGYGAFSPIVTKSLQKAIDSQGGRHKAVKISGCTFDELLAEISNGRPAIVWATYQMLVPKTVNSWYIIEKDGRERYFEYPRGTHVMVLTGFSDTTVTVVDPIKGVCTFNRSTFQNRWNLLGKQAVVMNKK